MQDIGRSFPQSRSWKIPGSCHVTQRKHCIMGKSRSNMEFFEVCSEWGPNFRKILKLGSNVHMSENLVFSSRLPVVPWLYAALCLDLGCVDGTMSVTDSEE